MDGNGGMGWLLIVIDCVSFPHSLLSTSKYFMMFQVSLSSKLFILDMYKPRPLGKAVPVLYLGNGYHCHHGSWWYHIISHWNLVPVEKFRAFNNLHSPKATYATWRSCRNLGPGSKLRRLRSMRLGPLFGRFASRSRWWKTIRYPVVSGNTNEAPAYRFQSGEVTGHDGAQSAEGLYWQDCFGTPIALLQLPPVSLQN